MRKLIFISAVSGVGKSTTCEYIKNNNMLDNYMIFDIDDLENINNYTSDNYNIFYENAIKKANELSINKNIIIGSCINPNDLLKINIPNEIDIYENILITCSNEELIYRLSNRDKNRNCSSKEYINNQINYQNYLLNNIDLYQLHLDNTNTSINDIANKIVEYLNSKED